MMRQHWDSLVLVIAAILLGGLFYHLSSLFPERSTVISGIFMIWVICAISGQFLLMWRIPERDQWVFPMVMLLCGLGLLVLSRLAPNLASRQAIWLIVALCVMLLIITPVAIHKLISWSWWIVGGAVMLLVATFTIGVHPSLPIGAPTLWLSLSRLFIQPSELLKFVLLIHFAGQISHRRWLNIVVIWGGVIVLLILQRDLGVAVLFGLVFWQLAYLTGVHRRILLIALIGMSILGMLSYFLFPVVRLRVMIWLNPWIDVIGDSYQLVQSLLAFADGGIFGLGLGMGSPSQVPLAHSDFIFSAVAEEWGLIGILMLMTLLTILIWRCWVIALRQPNHTQYFLALGVGVMLITQNVMIMAGALRILPLTGMPFTLVGYGGSSLVVTMMMIGVLIRLSNASSICTTEDISGGVHLSRLRVYQLGVLLSLGVIFMVAIYWSVLWRR